MCTCYTPTVVLSMAVNVTVYMYDYPERIAGDVGQDLVELQVLKVANNRLGEHEAELNNFITSAPV